MVAYYLAADPVGKIFDWHAYDGTTIPTKLENTVAVVAGEAGVAYSSCTYYDFRYPNATKMMLIAEALPTSGSDSFEVNLPGTFGFYERSWVLHNIGWYVDFHLDGEGIASVNYGTSQGTLTAAQLLPDVTHTITIISAGGGGHGGLALVYREVP